MSLFSLLSSQPIGDLTALFRPINPASQWRLYQS